MNDFEREVEKEFAIDMGVPLEQQQSLIEHRRQTYAQEAQVKEGRR
jgi:hypothetical protein